MNAPFSYHGGLRSATESTVSPFGTRSLSYSSDISQRNPNNDTEVAVKFATTGFLDWELETYKKWRSTLFYKTPSTASCYCIHSYIHTDSTIPITLLAVPHHDKTLYIRTHPAPPPHTHTHRHTHTYTHTHTHIYIYICSPWLTTPNLIP